MPASVLTPDTVAGVSSDITVTSIGTISMYRPLDDHLLLPDNSDFLLPDGVSLLLFPKQEGDSISSNDYLELRLKDPVGTYNPTGKWLRSTEPFIQVGPGIWQVRRPVVSSPIGVQVDLAS